MKKTVSCNLFPEDNRVAIYDAGGDYCGCVEEFNGEPVIQIFGDKDGLAYLSFENVEVIMDNWNQMKELRRGKNT